MSSYFLIENIYTPTLSLFVLGKSGNTSHFRLTSGTLCKPTYKKTIPLILQLLPAAEFKNTKPVASFVISTSTLLNFLSLNCNMLFHLHSPSSTLKRLLSRMVEQTLCMSMVPGWIPGNSCYMLSSSRGREKTFAWVHTELLTCQSEQ